MAGDQVVQVPPDSTGKNIATYEKIEGAKTVQVQKFVQAGHTPDDDVLPITSAPTGTEYAAPVRNIPSGTQAVSAAALPLPQGAATEVSLAALKAQTDAITASLENVRTDVRQGNQLLFLLLSSINDLLSRPGGSLPRS